MRRLGTALGVLFGLFLIARALVEPFVIDVHDPATYRLDWGGPSLAGVLAVHCAPGVVAAAVLVTPIVRGRRLRPNR
jgi:hypothetical protein